MKFFKYVFLVLLLLCLVCCASYGQENNLQKIFQLKENEIGFSSLCSKNNLLLISYYNNDDNSGGLYWFQNNKIIKSLQNIKRGEISPDGSHYSYVLNKVIYINDNKDFNIIKVPTQGYLDRVVWAYDSKTIYFCEEGKTFNKVYSFNIASKIKQEIISTKDQFFNPITVTNNRVIYLLQNIADESSPIPSCDIYQYDLMKKDFNKVLLPPIKNSTITYDFTVSPDEKIIMFSDISNKNIYVIDKNKVTIIDKIKIPSDTLNKVVFSWKNDSSYVIFTTTGKEIYKYIPPNLQ